MLTPTRRGLPESDGWGLPPGLGDRPSLRDNSPLRPMGARAASAFHQIPSIDEGGEERGKSRD